MHEFRGHRSSAPTIDINKQGTRLVTGSIEASVIVWDIPTPEQLGTRDVPFKKIKCLHEVQSVAFNGIYVVAGVSRSQTVTIDVETGEVIRKHCAHKHHVMSLVVLNEGAFFYFIFLDGNSFSSI